MIPWVVNGFGQLVEVEDRHLPGWTAIAEASTDWMRWNPFRQSPSVDRAERSDARAGLSWQELGRLRGTRRDLPRMVIELVLEAPSGDSLVAIELTESRCAEHLDSAVSVSVARSPGAQSSGAAQAVLELMPAFVSREIGHDHVNAEVCKANVRSLLLMQRLGWSLVSEIDCEYHHQHLVPCRGEASEFCSRS